MTDHSSGLGPNLLAVTSDRSIDFHKGLPEVQGRFGLTAAQIDWLKSRGISDPGKLVFPKQVHGDNIWRVTSKDAALAGRYEADAVVTNEVGLPIAVRTADCLPLLLYSQDKKVVAAVHAGWKGAKLEIAAKAVFVLQKEYGVQPQTLKAVIGPCIRRENYQVGPEFREHFPFGLVETPRGLCLDLAAVVTRQLLQSGLLQKDISDCRLCTYREQDRFYSFRREGEQAGRLIHLIMMI